MMANKWRETLTYTKIRDLAEYYELASDGINSVIRNDIHQLTVNDIYWKIYDELTDSTEIIFDETPTGDSK